MSNTRDFKPLKTAEPTEADLEAFAARRGIPTIRKAENTTKATKAGVSQAKDKAVTARMTLDLPTYLINALKRRAIDKHSTVRFLILQALQKDGFNIDEQDLVPDGRRIR